VVEDSAKANKSAIFTSDFVRFAKWFTALYSEESETLGSGTTSSKVVVTPEMRADLDKQGMPGPLDLFGFELARCTSWTDVALGRVSEVGRVRVAAPSTRETRGTLAPAGQYQPRSHSPHVSAPVALWYEPGAQSAHTAAPSTGETVPAAQAVCATLPVDAENPGALRVHSAALPRSVALE
jgi:hypothetical protein